MNNTIYAVIGVVILVGIGGYFLFGKDKSDSDSMQNEMEEMMSGRSSFKSLLGLNTPQKCTFSDTTETSETSGTVYVANGKMRGDFVSTTDAGPMNSHMVVADNTSYIWSDGMADGIKMSLEAVDQPDVQQNQNNAVELNKEVDYSCERWSGDENMFDLPANVTFNDMSEMMNTMMNQMNVETDAGANVSGDVGAQQCEACAQVPEAYRAQCLESLGCS